MRRRPVDSSDLRSVGYDSDTSTLEIEFHSGGIYQYSNVPTSVYHSLLSAGSHGRYFHSYIKGIYPYSKVG